MERVSSLKNIAFDDDCGNEYDEHDDSKKICITCNGNVVKSLKIEGVSYTKEEYDTASGGSGDVSFYFDSENRGICYAVKTFRDKNEYLYEFTKISLLKSQNNYPSYVVPAYEIINDTCYLSIMHCKDGDLNNLIYNPNIQLTTSETIDIFNEIINAIMQLVDLNFMYSDLKPANVLFEKQEHNNDRKYKIYLCDIGSLVPIIDEEAGSEAMKNAVVEIRKINKKGTLKEQRTPENEVMGHLKKRKRQKNEEKKSLETPFYFEENGEDEGFFNGKFTYPTLNFYPVLPYLDRNGQNDFKHQFLCNFYHQISYMYLVLCCNKQITKIDKNFDFR